MSTKRIIETMNHVKFGKLLRQARKANGRTLRDVAHYLGVNVPYLSDVELGRRRPFSLKRIEQVARYLNADVDQLLLAAFDQLSFVQLIIPTSRKTQFLGVIKAYLRIGTKTNG